MSNSERTLWGIHAGKTGDAETLFLKRNYIALGWSKIGDLGQLPAQREAFKTHFIARFPDKKPGAVPIDAGQLFRFVHEMQVGDLVAYPSKNDRQIHIGEITGGYEYKPSLENRIRMFAR